MFGLNIKTFNGRSAVSLWKWLVFRLFFWVHVDVIGEDSRVALGPLLVRFEILHTRRLRVYLHHIMRSDAERHLHDHPWSFVSIILRGGYREHTMDGSRDYKAPAILFRPATWAHKLELQQPAWTLVFATKTVRRWGFLTEKGWCFWRNYDYTNGGCQE